MIGRHPNRRQLARWLDGDATELDEHIGSCAKCAETLDALAEAETKDLRPALMSLLTPPTDLEERVSRRLAARLQSRADVELFGALLGIPIETGRVVMEGSDASG